MYILCCSLLPATRWCTVNEMENVKCLKFKEALKTLAASSLISAEEKLVIPQEFECVRGVDAQVNLYLFTDIWISCS